MSTKLHEVLAIAKGAKSAQDKIINKYYQDMGKRPLFDGMTRVYQKKDDDGDDMPPESVLVQRKAPDALAEVRKAFARIMDIQGEIDTTNRSAVAAVFIDGVDITGLLPATHLLWLEKQLTDIRTVVSSLPTLDPAHTWSWDAQQGLWTTEELRTARNKKVLRNHVKAQATEKHPAQVEVFSEDVRVGDWVTRKLSGAVPATEVAALLARVDAVIVAVKQARERANSTESVKATSAGVLDYIFS